MRSLGLHRMSGSGCWSVVALVFCLFGNGSALASENAERALAQLVKDVQRTQSKLAANKSENGYYTTRPGDTVDMILKRMMPNMPVKKSILRQALVKANPHAFKRSNPNWMYANKRLRLPGASDIHNVVFVEQTDKKQSRRDERQSWVKFP